MTGRTTPLPLTLLVCGLLVSTAAVMALESLAVAADGAYYLVRIVELGEIFGPNGRLLANAVREAPALVAAQAGVTNMHTLSILLGVGQLVVPALVWSAAIVLARPDVRAFAAVSLAAGLCAGTTWFFSVSESVLAVPLTVLAGVLLWLPRPWRWSHAVTAAAVSVVLIASYETAAATGAVLTFWAIRRSRASHTAVDRYGTAAVAVASAASVGVALVGSVAGKGPSNARSALYFVLSADPWPLYVGLLASAAVVAALTARSSPAVRWGLLGAGVTGGAVAIAGVETSSVAAFQARAGAVLVALLLLAYLYWLWDRGAVIPWSPVGSARTLLLALPVAFTAAMLATSLVGLQGWTQSLYAFRTAVDETNGVVLAEEVLPPGRRQVLWDWTSSSLSLVTRRHPDAGVLVDRDPSFVPFPPHAASDELGDEFKWPD